MKEIEVVDVIDLGAERNRRASPDHEFVSKDEYGRDLFTFLLSYDFEGSSYSTQLVAYSAQDAEAKVMAMRRSLRLDGQLFSAVPA